MIILCGWYFVFSYLVLCYAQIVLSVLRYCVWKPHNVLWCVLHAVSSKMTPDSCTQI